MLLLLLILLAGCTSTYSGLTKEEQDFMKEQQEITKDFAPHFFYVSKTKQCDNEDWQKRKQRAVEIAKEGEKHANSFDGAQNEEVKNFQDKMVDYWEGNAKTFAKLNCSMVKGTYKVAPRTKYKQCDNGRWVKRAMNCTEDVKSHSPEKYIYLEKQRKYCSEEGCTKSIVHAYSNGEQFKADIYLNGSYYRSRSYPTVTEHTYQSYFSTPHNPGWNNAHDFENATVNGIDVVKYDYDLNSNEKVHVWLWLEKNIVMKFESDNEEYVVTNYSFEPFEKSVFD